MQKKELKEIRDIRKEIAAYIDDSSPNANLIPTICDVFMEIGKDKRKGLFCLIPDILQMLTEECYKFAYREAEIAGIDDTIEDADDETETTKWVDEHYYKLRSQFFAATDIESMIADEIGFWLGIYGIPD